MEKNLVSIIIPIFNRETLIAETLNSILKQKNYNNWECILVDDGSTDGTLKVLKGYHKSDARIRFYSRPDSLPKGANSCRNFGFEKSAGKYIIWFDSDDLMTPDHIEQKLRFIQENNLDFAVARTRNFQDVHYLQPYKYVKKQYGIKASDFILLKIHWYTYDVMLRREIAEKISWNEKMKSWQDYNYFCKMLLRTERGDYLDKILTHRRIHERSIQKNLKKDELHFKLELIENRYLTFLDLQKSIPEETRIELLYGMMNLSYEICRSGIHSEIISGVLSFVKDYLGSTSLLYFRASLFLVAHFKKGYFLLEKAKKRTEFF